MDGSIDFMCLPEFDSPSVFAALLDHRRGGRFQLAPLLDGARQKQLYLPDTCVLLTRFLAGTGIAEVSDFMPVEDMGHQHDVVRRAKTVRGEVRFRMLCQPRFDYARASHTAERTPDGVRFVSSGSHSIALHLRASVPLRIEAGAALAEFTLRADESAWFVLEQLRPGEDSPSAAPDYVADAFKRWVEARCAELEPDGALQIMYGIDGRHRLSEETLPHLEGYMRSAPVRIGNAAFTDIQLDIYGELMDAIYLYDKYGSPISYDLWANVSRFVDWVCTHWRDPDESIWEVRGGRQEFLYSRVLCWATLDRAVRLAQKRSFPAPLARWHDVRDELYRDIFTTFWHR